MVFWPQGPSLGVTLKINGKKQYINNTYMKKEISFLYTFYSVIKFYNVNILWHL